MNSLALTNFFFRIGSSKTEISSSPEYTPSSGDRAIAVDENNLRLILDIVFRDRRGFLLLLESWREISREMVPPSMKFCHCIIKEQLPKFLSLSR